MTQLAALFRYLQFFAHAAHNTVKGENFFADHGFLGDLYGTYEAAYDSIIERMLGLGQTPNIVGITAAGASLFAAADQEDTWGTLIAGEVKLRELVDAAIAEPGASQGTINMLVDLADQSEARTYKLCQRSYESAEMED